MGVNERFHQNFEGNIRVDLPDFRSVTDRLKKDIDYLVQTFIDLDGYRVLNRYREATHAGLVFKLQADSRRAFYDKDGAFIFMTPQNPGNTLDIALAPSTTNYVMVKKKERKGDLQTRAFWDVDLGLAGEEFFDDINIKLFTEEDVFADTTIDPEATLLFTVTTTPSTVNIVIDNQDLLWKPRAATLPSLASDRGTTWDDLTDLRGWIDTAAQLITELKGTDVANKPYRSMRMLREFQDLFITGGGDISFELTLPADADKLAWTSDISIEIAGRPQAYTIDVGSVIILDGECMYVEIPDGLPSGSLTPVVADFTSVPVVPTDAGYNEGIKVLFYRKTGTLYGTMDIPELDSGETGTIGQDLPQAIRERLGITGETSYEDYSDTSVVELGDNYPTAISKLNRIHGRTFDPIGHVDTTESSLSYSVGSRTLTLSLTGPELEVYLSGGKLDTKTVAEILAHTNVSGWHYFYFDTNGDLQVSTTEWQRNLHVPVAAVLFNSTSVKGRVMDERHTVFHDWKDRQYLHLFEGAQYKSGFGLGSYTLNVGNDASEYPTIAAGVISKEGFDVSIVDDATPTANYEQNLAGRQIPTLFVTATLAWNWDAATGLYVKHSAGVPQLNNPTTGAQTAITDGYYFNVFVYATNAISEPVVIVQAQAQYATLNEALQEQRQTLPSLPAFWLQPLYRLTYKYDSALPSTANASLAVAPLDLRSSGSIRSTSATTLLSHGALEGRSLTGSHPASAISAYTPNFDQEILTASDDDAQKALVTLGNRAKLEALHVRQNKTMKLIDGGDWSWDGATLTITQTAYIQIGGLLNTRNQIAAQSFAVPATHVVYVAVNRTGVTTANLTLLSAAPESVPVGDNIYIVARRSGNNLIVGNDNLKLVPGQIGKLGSLEVIYNEVVAGENLSDRDAVYISDGTGVDAARTAGRVYKADASIEYRAARFIGFAPKAVVAGSAIDIQQYGRLKGFSGLTAGTAYYLSPITAGAITATVPTTPNYAVLAGYARSADTLLIDSFVPQSAGLLEPGSVSSSTSGTVGTSGRFAREDHSHDLGTHTHVDAATGGNLFSSAEPPSVSTSTSGTAGVSTLAARGDHSHDLGSHTHIDAASGGNLFAALEPGTVSSSTSGTVGVSTLAAREDHSHDLGSHTHTDAASGGNLFSSSEPPAVSTSTSGTAGVSTLAARGDHSHDLGAHDHLSAASGGLLSGTHGINITGNAATATVAACSTVTATNTAATYYVSFVDATTGSRPLNVDTGLTYNPSTNALTATTFVGALSGNATTATCATCIGVTAVTSGVMYPTFVSGATSGSFAAQSDANISFDAATNTLTTTCFAGKATNSDQLAGKLPCSTAHAGDSIVQRNASGYIYSNYFNMTANDVVSGVTQVAVETGNDGFLRWGSCDAIRTFLGLPASFIGGSGTTNCYAVFTGGTTIGSGTMGLGTAPGGIANSTSFFCPLFSCDQVAWTEYIRMSGALGFQKCIVTASPFNVWVSMNSNFFGCSTGSGGALSMVSGCNTAGTCKCGVVGWGSQFDFYASGTGTNYGPFTGGHDSYSVVCNMQRGMVLAPTGIVVRREDSLSTILVELKPACANESPYGILASCGAIADEIQMRVDNDIDERTWFQCLYTQGQLPAGAFRIATNSLGEGLALVVDANGDIAVGDLLSTSIVPGYAAKQSDNIFRSITLGKATENIDWSTVTTTLEHDGITYKYKLVAITYHCG